MSVKAIVYTSSTGFTRQYALMLSRRTGLPAYTISESKKNLPQGAKIVYLGWIMASSVSGFNQAVQRYNVIAVAGVGLSPAGAQEQEVRKATGVPADMPLITLQGGFDMKKLNCINKLIMKVVRKKITKSIEEKPVKTAEDKLILDMLWNGNSAVNERDLDKLMAYFD